MTTHSTEIKDLAAALSLAQGQLEGAKKDSENPFFKSKYADLASVWDACRPQLTGNGLSVVQGPSVDGAKVTLTTMLLHSSGQWVRSEVSAIAKSDDPQSIGSCITYLRRYALSAIVGIAPEDDDGNAGSQPENQPEQQRQVTGSNYKCPECGVEAVIAGRADWGGGWVCWTKRGGCGKKFDADAFPPKSKPADPKPDSKAKPGPLHATLTRAKCITREDADSIVAYVCRDFDEPKPKTIQAVYASDALMIDTVKTLIEDEAGKATWDGLLEKAKQEVAAEAALSR